MSEPIDAIQAWYERPVVSWCLFGVNVVTAVCVSHFLGEIALTRFFGVMFVLGSVMLLFVREVAFSLGGTVVARFRGWKKLIVCVPFACFGAVIAWHAEPFTCMATKYKHLCEKQ